MLEREYALVRSTHRFHLYEWTGAPDDSKSFEKQIYLPKTDLGEDPPERLMMRIGIE